MAAPVGIVLGSALAPEEIRASAQLGERLGFAEIWLAEDFFFTGGISGATAALAATERIPVGLGIVSAMARHPALLAMEVATVSRMHPGRLRTGIGLGVPAWVEQMGLMPRSPLTAMRECLSGVRRLLDGETVDGEGRYFSFHDVTLTYPPQEPCPLYMGVIGPRMLRLAGEVADGTVGSVLATPEYVRWAREQIGAGQDDVGRRARHSFAAYVLFSCDRDGRRAREAVRPALAFYLAATPKTAMSDVYGLGDAALELAQAGGAELIEREMPAQWVEDLVVAGTPEECAAKLRRFLEAGADTVDLFPAPAERATEMFELAAAEVLPRL